MDQEGGGVIMILMAAQDILQEESPAVDKRDGREEERSPEEKRLYCWLVL